jgi:hypothetical protein
MREYLCPADRARLDRLAAMLGELPQHEADARRWAGYVAAWNARGAGDARDALLLRVRAHEVLERVRAIDGAARHFYRIESPEGIHSRSAAWLIDRSDGEALPALGAAEHVMTTLGAFIAAAARYLGGGRVAHPAGRNRVVGNDCS